MIELTCDYCDKKLNGNHEDYNILTVSKDGNYNNHPVSIVAKVDTKSTKRHICQKCAKKAVAEIYGSNN